MLDARVYRAAFLPAFLMLFVAAFSLENRPSPATTSLAPEAFSAARAFGDANPPPRNSLRELTASFPNRPPGSAGDALLADRVAQEFAAGGRFEVHRTVLQADTGRDRRRLENVVGVRPGVSSRRIVVVAHRDATGRGAAAELSGTAALLELARIADLRDLQRTLVVVSTSGGTTGAAGARTWARAAGDPSLVDGVLVLGDVAGRESRRPWIVPWSNDRRPAPLALRRTVETAVRAEVRAEPGAARALVQWVRRALPMTVTEQGELLANDMPAVLLQVSGEPGPQPGTEASRRRMELFGRTALRTITALDQMPVPRLAAGAAQQPAPPAGTDGIVTLRKVLPTWVVRVAAFALLIPALLVAARAWLRAARGGEAPLRWLAWAAALATPVLAAWAWARLLDLTGLLNVPRAPAMPAAVPVGTAGTLAVVSTLVVGVAAWYLLRPLIARATGAHGNPAHAGGAAGVAALVCLLTLVLVAGNPYAALVLVPAAHAWSLAAARVGASPGPASRRSGLTAVSVPAGMVLPLLVLAVYGVSLDMDAFELLWLLFTAAAGGGLGFGTAIALSLLLGCALALLSVLRGRRGAGVAAIGISDGDRLAGPARFESLGGASRAGRR